MSLLASIRPDSWNLALLVHVGGAMILTGGVLAAASAIAVAKGDARMLRLGYFSLLAAALPGWVLMWVGAEWIYSKEGLDDAPIDLDWVAIGFIVAEGGGVLLLVALILGGIGLRRLPRGGTGLLKATMVISVVLLAAYLVAVWAMSAKPV